MGFLMGVGAMMMILILAIVIVMVAMMIPMMRAVAAIEENLSEISFSAREIADGSSAKEEKEDEEQPHEGIPGRRSGGGTR